MNKYNFVRPVLDALIARGHSVGYIVAAMNGAQIPTVSGRGRWCNAAIVKACAVLDLPAPKYRPV